MLIVLYFTCQSVNSKVTIKPHLGYIILLSKPSDKLFDKEISSCNLFQNLTALYTIRVAENIFRSKFISYDWQKEIELRLYPDDTASIRNAAQFTIASLTITFLENSLVQQGAIGQLIVTMFDYNQCIEGNQILFETYKYLDPLIIINHDCIVSTTGDVKYTLTFENEQIYQKIIPQPLFDFSTISLEKFNCNIGSTKQKAECKQWTQIVSIKDYLILHWTMEIAKKIKTQNIYVDEYGVQQNDIESYHFNFTFSLLITQRKSIENCTEISQVGFYANTIFIEQTPINVKMCPIYSDYSIQYWLRVSEFEDHTGEKFQLQFYNKVMYRIDQWIDCDTWEISGYNDYKECFRQLQKANKFQNNMSLQISTIVYEDKIYTGAVHVTPMLINSGFASITVTGSEICVHIQNFIELNKQFIGLDLTISYNSKDFSEKKYNYAQTNYFEFPSKDKTYCFTGNKEQIETFNSFVYISYFGTVKIMNNIFSVNNLDAYADYDIFWEGGVFFINCIILCIIWVIIRSKRCRTKK